MKTEKNILIAFLLNLSFAVLEWIGGLLTGSIAIVSDAVHDLGDAVSIGISYVLEKMSRRPSDHTHTYGYTRYSVLGSLITTLILLVGSAAVMIGAVQRLIRPTEIDYNGMIMFAVIGVCVNLIAAVFTHGEGSLNQRAVNLHMLEDVFGWIVVLFGAILMRFTDISRIDPLLSIGVSLFILIHAVRNLLEVLDIFLDKAPRGMDVDALMEHLTEIDGVAEVHHLHVRTFDGYHHDAVMHIVTDAAADASAVKERVREELSEHGIGHATLELERVGEHCHARACSIGADGGAEHHHHHHHHH